MASKEAPGTYARALLGSGLFLERETFRAFAQAGFSVSGPYEYSRRASPDEENHYESVDLLATKIVPMKEHLVAISCFVECKYNNPATMAHWVFVQPPADPFALVRYSMLPQFGTGKEKTQTRTASISPNVPALGPGTSLYRQENGTWAANPNVLSNAVRQALMSSLDACVADGLHELVDLDHTLKLYVPVVVTNSDCFLLPDDNSMGELEKAVFSDEVLRKAALLEVGKHLAATPIYARDYVARTIRRGLRELAQEFDENSVQESGDLLQLGTASFWHKWVPFGKPKPVASVCNSLGEQWVAKLQALED